MDIMLALTSIYRFIHRALDSALVRLSKSLSLQRCTCSTETARFHGFLQCITLPAEYIVLNRVRMPSTLIANLLTPCCPYPVLIFDEVSQTRTRTSEVVHNSRIPLTKHKRLRPISRPQRLIVERRRVPNNLEHQLRQFNRMSRRAGTTVLKRPRRRVADVRRMVGAIEVLAIPASSSTRLISDPKHFQGNRGEAYVGNRIVVLMPPGQATFGNSIESTLLSEHGAALSPPKFFAL